MPLRYLTAGGAHGHGRTAGGAGFPGGVPIDIAVVNRDLARRMQGYGRGGRMKIEQDQVELRSGVRWGESLGSPITLWIENRDWRNWEKKMSPRPEDRDPNLAVTRPRPGHADLAGVLKYNHRDVRNVLERASARETAARVAVGGVAKCLLAPFGIRVFGWVVEIGGIAAQHGGLTAEEIFARAEESPVRVADSEAERRIMARIDECKAAGDTLGGVVETVAVGLPPGLGSHAQWDRKLDGRLAHALMSVQAAKGVEIGLGFATARRPGSQVHDEIYFDEGTRRFVRRNNNAGGTEGGMSSGGPVGVPQVILTGFMATGKTEVGRRLARRLGRPFVDIDGLVEAASGKKVADIFASEGEARFRQLERAAVAEACLVPEAVVATGGGTLLDAENRRRLAAAGPIVCLAASPEEILRRVGDPRPRPLLADGSTGGERLARIRQLLAERAPTYALATHAVDTSGLSVDEVVERVRALVAGR